jgi:hypothetical protein
MSQQTNESVIGRLVTDEGFRRRFKEGPGVVIAELIASGVPLTSVERRALLELDLTACDQFAERMDPRLQKISLRRSCS